jgi:hypothetical protein
MATPAPEVPEVRKKRTVWLLAGGAASLLIPLAGAIYLHMSQNAGAPPPSGRNDLFERREGADQKLTPTQTVVVPTSIMAQSRSGIVGAAEKPSGSSLDFIKSNDEMKARLADSRTAMPAAVPPPPSAAAPVEAVAESTATSKRGKPGKKAFSMPKLQPSRGFTNFGSTGGSKSGAPGGQDLLKDVAPAGANDPRVQAYIKQHQKGN